MRFALAALACCAACGPQMDPCTLVGPGGVGGFGGQGGFDFDGGFGGGSTGSVQAILTNTPASISLAVEPTQVCNHMKTAVTGVKTTVLGPDNLPVEHMNSGATTGSSEFDAYTTTITFTPKQAGDYHFVAEFQPNLGIAQLDLLAAVNFTQLPATETFSTAVVPVCSRPAVTGFGALICDDGTQTPRVYRKEGPAGDIVADSFAVRGNTVWAASNTNDVSRYVDVGSGQLLAMETFTVSQPVFKLVPIGDDAVLVVTSAGAERWKASDAGFTQDHVWMVGGGAGAGVKGAAIDGDDVLYATSNQLFESSDGGTELTPGPSLGFMLSFGPDGIWALNPDETVLELYRPGQALPKTLNVGLGWFSDDPTRYDVVPWTLQYPRYVAQYDPNQDTLVLADFGTAQGNTIEAGRDWAVMTEMGTDLLVKKMPAP